MVISELIAKNREEFRLLCIKYNVKRLYGFGSSVSGKFDVSSSDIDLIIEIDVSDPLEKGELLLNIWDALEVFFGRKVDLLTEPIKNPYLNQNIQQNKLLIYDGTGEEILI